MPAKVASRKRKQSQSGEGSSSSALDSVHRSYSYEDLGYCDQVCEFCSARFWYPERSCKSLVGERPKYTICCRSKKVRMRYPINPPRVIKELFGDKAFLPNVRRYNSMFAMTSFGSIPLVVGPSVERATLLQQPLTAAAAGADALLDKRLMLAPVTPAKTAAARQKQAQHNDAAQSIDEEDTIQKQDGSSSTKRSIDTGSGFPAGKKKSKGNAQA